VNAHAPIVAAPIQIADTEACRAFLICELRRMSTRARLAALECDSIGVALKCNLIAPEAAIEWLQDIDAPLLDLIGSPMVVPA
jgi:hypothetical protein